MRWSSKLKAFRDLWHFDNRLHLLVSRIFFRGESLNVFRYNDVEFIEDHENGDANGAREVLLSTMYSRFLPLMNFSSAINVLDLGSNNGGFPLLLKSRNIAIRRLACVEMNPATFSRMRFNIERNFHCPSVLLNAAVCGETREIAVASGRGSVSNNIYDQSAGEHPIMIAGLTFDAIYQQAFANETVDICKIDIERAEFEMFSGNHYESVVNCRYLLIEIHHGGAFRRNDVIDRILAKGFKEVEGEAKTAEDEHYVHFFFQPKA